MKFGRVAVAEAGGAILAHTVRWDDGVLRKGITLRDREINRLREAGVREVMVAQPERNDIPEDEVASRIAKVLVPEPSAQGLRIGPGAKGRVNIFAESTGLFRVRADAVDSVNRAGESVTLATLADCTQVAPRQLVATVKVIPYAVAEDILDSIVASVAGDPMILAVRGVTLQSAALLVTRASGTPEKLAARGVPAVRARLGVLGVPLERVTEVPHDTQALTDAIDATTQDLVLVLGDTATSDRNDVAAAAIVEAGGEIVRFGMPVDPGNLLLLAKLAQRWVIVLPGCARSPKLNGADWVLERIACGVSVSTDDIAGMGVGGLLHEIPQRPAPRVGGAEAPAAPRVSVILLAAGMSRRMGEKNKLLEEVDGEPLVARVARALVGSRAQEVIAVTGHQAEQVEIALQSDELCNLRIVRNPVFEEGIGSSIRTGFGAVARDADAVIVAFADTPGTSTELVNKLIGCFDPSAGQSICRLRGPDGEPGHPVLFGRRYFEVLGSLSGDQGAREVVTENASDVFDLIVDAAAVVDLDTEADWGKWKKAS